MVNQPEPIAVIAAPSTTTDVALTMRTSAYNQAVHGQLVAFLVTVTSPSDGAVWDELALGTITRVETVNPVHSPQAPDAFVIAQRGTVGVRTGDTGDIRAIAVAVEAVFRRDHTEAGGWRPAGSSLSNSPATGTAVTLVGQALMDDLMANVGLRRYLGHLHNTRVLVPFTEADFSGKAGARMMAVAGATGSGKTAVVTYQMACELAHDTMGQIVFDPQGQFASELGMVFSLQGLAAALGRTVTVLQLARDLRLSKDAPMLFNLLDRGAQWFRDLSFGDGSTSQVDAATRVFLDALESKRALEAATGTTDWTEANPGLLLRYLLERLYVALPSGTVYAGSEGQRRVQALIRKPTVEELVESGECLDVAEAQRRRDRMPDGALDADPDSETWLRLYRPFFAVVNLWSPFTPEGAWRVWHEGTDPNSLTGEDRRRAAWSLLRDVFADDPTRPAPWLILDLSSDDIDLGVEGDETVDKLESVLRSVVDNTGVKTRIMQQLIDETMRVGVRAFKAGKPLNCRITIDESSLFAIQPDSSTDKSVAALSDALVDFVERARKVGVGIRFILQSLQSMRDAIYRQCNMRIVGYGLLEQADLKRLDNVIGAAHTQLYRAIASPEASGKYTFLFSGGGLTGLSLGPKPVFLDIHTDPTEWLSDNAEWITAARRRWTKHLPASDPGGALTALPARPQQTLRNEHRYTTKAHTAAAGNTTAATALVSAAAANKTPATFGWGAPKTVPDPNDEPPPF